MFYTLTASSSIFWEIYISITLEWHESSVAWCRRSEDLWWSPSDLVLGLGSLLFIFIPDDMIIAPNRTCRKGPDLSAGAVKLSCCQVKISSSCFCRFSSQEQEVILNFRSVLLLLVLLWLSSNPIISEHYGFLLDLRMMRCCCYTSFPVVPPLTW